MLSRATEWMGSTSAILLLPVVCLVAFVLLGANTVTFILSVASITICQMLLKAGKRNEQAIQLKLDGIIAAIDKADDALIGLEKKTD